MSPLIKTNDRVKVVKGDHAGAIGWVTGIEVEPTSDIKALVLIKVELSRPYGHVIDALPSMIIKDENRPQ